MIEMEKSRITITLDGDVRTWVHAQSKSTGKSQSEIVRMCLREFIAIYPAGFPLHDKPRPKSEHGFKRDI